VTYSAFDYTVVAGAAAIAGLVNAIAGGGTLVSFPAMVAIGVPTKAANVTNTVALCPGYFGGAAAQRRDLATQRHRARRLAIVSAIGGLAGSILLIITPEDAFRASVPFLILIACGLLASQETVRRWLRRHHPNGDVQVGRDTGPSVALSGTVCLSAVYGGFFGAGLGIMLLAVLGLFLDDSLIRLNALKTTLSFVINVAAALFFALSGQVEWPLVPVMAVASLLGGAAGGRVARHMKPQVLRVIVVLFGVAVAIRFWVGT